MTSKPKILAPAGNMESLLAAVNSGADAVYVGTRQFNARRNASNFDAAGLKYAALYCRARGVKIYLALNTLLYDDELPFFAEEVKTACAAPVDAIIVQDLAAMRIIRDMAPAIPLHASTQMTAHNADGVNALKELGFTSVVLAREMSGKEVASVLDQADIETEMFVHGSLCACVSGQCYMSVNLGGRSANRGLCAQPCRLPFGNGHALSLKDLSLISRMHELSRLGVTTLKIEGRMKRPEYVAAAVSACRAALDGGVPDLKSLRAVFSRDGFTDGYFTARRDSSMFGVRNCEKDTSPLHKKLRNVYKNEYPHITINFRFELLRGRPAFLEIADRNGNSASARGAVPTESTGNPIGAELIKRNLSKLGGTYFSMGEFAADIDNGLTLTAAEINRMRRDALSELDQKRSASVPAACRQPPDFTWRQRRFSQKPAIRARLGNAKQLTQSVLSRCELISLPLNEILRLDRKIIEKHSERLAAELPRCRFGDSPDALPRIKESGIARALAGDLGGCYAAKRLGFTLHGGFSLNISNTIAMREYEKLGLSDVTISPELNLRRIRELGDGIKRGIIAYGHLPLMIMRGCPVGGARQCGTCPGMIKDRKGYEFALECSQGLCEIYNPHAIYLADKLGDIDCADFMTLYFTRETHTQCDNIISDYMFGGSPKEGITRGRLYSGRETGAKPER